MKRQWISIGLAALGLVLFGFIVSTLAAPKSADQQEVEPNNTVPQANSLGSNTVVKGALTWPGDFADTFSFSATQGRRYGVSLQPVVNPGGYLLVFTVYDAEGDKISGSEYSSAAPPELQWNATDPVQYVQLQVVGLGNITPTVQVVSYTLKIDRYQSGETPIPTPRGLDAYEPNDVIGDAHKLPIAVSAIASSANFTPTGDIDWFSYYAKKGRHYQAETSNLIGVDTVVAVHNPGGTKITSDNDGAGGFASRAQWRASETGWYDIRVTNLVTSTASDTYDLTVSEIAAPPTATPTPAPVSPGQIDRCEDNSNLDRACTIAANDPATFNFVSPHTGPDNDFYRVWTKPGMLFSCRTSNLAPGVDPNMILYDQNRDAIGENDDVAPGDYNSALSYYATYSGWLYVLVGYGNRTPSDVAASSYTLNCATSLPGAATPTSQAAAPTATPRPGGAPTATPVPVATTEPVPQLSVRVLATPVPGAGVTPAPRFVPIELLVYYDANGDGQPGAGEGIGGLSAEVYDAATNRLLAQGAADDQGHLEFTVAAQGPVRVSIPFLGFSQLVATRGGSIYVRVAAASGTGGAN